MFFLFLVLLTPLTVLYVGALFHDPEGEDNREPPRDQRERHRDCRGEPWGSNGRMVERLHHSDALLLSSIVLTPWSARLSLFYLCFLKAAFFFFLCVGVSIFFGFVFLDIFLDPHTKNALPHTDVPPPELWHRRSNRSFKTFTPLNMS